MDNQNYLKKYREELDKVKELYGWDDGKIYFMFDELNQELCVTDETALYQQLIDLCYEYYHRKYNEQSNS